MKPKLFKVTFHTWKEVDVVVMADDEDEAINLAEQDLDDADTVNYEVTDVVIIADGDNRL